MKTIARLLVLAVVATGLAGCLAPQPATTAAHPAAPNLTYTVTVVRASHAGDLTDGEWEQVRLAVGKFLDDEGQPQVGEYVLRVDLATAAPGQPAGWAEVKLTINATMDSGLIAANPLSPGGYAYPAVPGDYEYRDYYPYEIFPDRYYVSHPRFTPPHRPDNDDHNRDHDHDGGHPPDRPGNPPGPGAANHNPNDEQHHHRPVPVDPHRPDAAAGHGTDHRAPPAHDDSMIPAQNRGHGDDHNQASTGNRPGPVDHAPPPHSAPPSYSRPEAAHAAPPPAPPPRVESAPAAREDHTTPPAKDKTEDKAGEK